MSRPYININTMSYTNSVLTMNYSYFKLRAQPAELVITGFSNSISFTERNANCDYTAGSTAQTLTFSVPTALGFPTANTPTFNDPSVALTFNGTVSTNTNLKVTIGGSLVVNATASAGPTLSNYLTAIANAGPYGSGVYTATLSGTNSLIFTPTNTGNLYNGRSFTAVATPGASSFTMSGLPATFSGGITNYSVLITYNTLGYSESFIFSN